MNSIPENTSESPNDPKLSGAVRCSAWLGVMVELFYGLQNLDATLPRILGMPDHPTRLVDGKKASGIVVAVESDDNLRHGDLSSNRRDFLRRCKSNHKELPCDCLAVVALNGAKCKDVMLVTRI